MFELKYKITDADMKSVNTRIMWQYFIPYVVVALLGLAAGITATVLRPRTVIFVLGIILLVLAAILLVCAVLMSVAPKNFVASALLTSDETERGVVFSDKGITIKTPDQSDIHVDYAEILRVKNRKSYLLLYVDKDVVFLVKNAIVSGGTLEELYATIASKITRKPVADGKDVKPVVSENKADSRVEADKDESKASGGGKENAPNGTEENEGKADGAEDKPTEPNAAEAEKSDGDDKENSNVEQ